MPVNKVKMSDIAARFGVSVVTVSKALRNKDGVGEELRNKIRAAATEMGYDYRPAEDEQKNLNMGIVIAERYLKPEHSFYSALYLKVAEALKNAGYYNTLEVVRDFDEASGIIPGFLEQRHVKGVMVLAPMKTVYLKALESTGVPMTLTDFYHSDINAVSIITDSFLGSRDMTRYLIGKGHTRIGFVGSIEKNTNSRDRHYGYCKAMGEAGLPVKKEWVIPDRNPTGFKDVFELPRDMPTAFVCTHDQSAYHFTRYILSRGYKIPDDISVTGFYDHTFSILAGPAITTFRIDIGFMAGEAVKAQIMLIKGKKELPPRIIISGRIIERSSVLFMNGG